MQQKESKEKYRSPEVAFFELKAEGVICDSADPTTVTDPFSEFEEFLW